MTDITSSEDLAAFLSKSPALLYSTLVHLADIDARDGRDLADRLVNVPRPVCGEALRLDVDLSLFLVKVTMLLNHKAVTDFRRLAPADFEAHRDGLQPLLEGMPRPHRCPHCNLTPEDDPPLSLSVREGFGFGSGWLDRPDETKA